jgi:hypothetical protein
MEALFNKHPQPREIFEDAQHYHDEEEEIDATLPRTKANQP